MATNVRTVRLKEYLDGYLYKNLTPSSTPGWFLFEPRGPVQLDLEQLQMSLFAEHADWGLYFPEATGSRQSPIDLVSCDARYEELLANTPLQFSYFTSRETDILNNGYTLVVFPRAKQADMQGGPRSESVPHFSNTQKTSTQTLMHNYPGTPHPEKLASLTQRLDTGNCFSAATAMSGGPLPRGMEYELAEIRFHWGRENGRGSEHTVNGKAFPMEVQFVHWNTRLYESIEAAVGRPNGIVIVSLFTQLGREHHGLKLITDNLEDVQYKGRQKTMTAPFNPGSFMPDPMLRDYWTYEGSLTTPPCSENVTWILMRYPLMVSYQQMEEFRRLKTHNRGEQPRPGDDGTMADNFRPTQPLNGRIVRASFQY